MPADPHLHAAHLDLQLIHGRHGDYLHVQANGGYDVHAWIAYRDHLYPFLEQVVSVNLSKVEIAWDVPNYLDSVLVVPTKVRGSFRVQENGYYYGARASDYALAVYDRAHRIAEPLNPLIDPLTRIETRVRASLPVVEAPTLAGCLGRIGVYIIPGQPNLNAPMLLFSEAWKRSDTRARERFLQRIESFHLAPDIAAAMQALRLFAFKAVPADLRSRHPRAKAEGNGGITWKRIPGTEVYQILSDTDDDMEGLPLAASPPRLSPDDPPNPPWQRP